MPMKLIKMETLVMSESDIWLSSGNRGHIELGGEWEIGEKKKSGDEDKSFIKLAMKERKTKEYMRKESLSETFFVRREICGHV